MEGGEAGEFGNISAFFQSEGFFILISHYHWFARVEQKEAEFIGGRSNETPEIRLVLNAEKRGSTIKERWSSVHFLHKHRVQNEPRTGRVMARTLLEKGSVKEWAADIKSSDCSCSSEQHSCCSCHMTLNE